MCTKILTVIVLTDQLRTRTEYCFRIRLIGHFVSENWIPKELFLLTHLSGLHGLDGRHKLIGAIATRHIGIKVVNWQSVRLCRFVGGASGCVIPATIHSYNGEVFLAVVIRIRASPPSGH